jgi:hypothetical protein
MIPDPSYFTGSRQQRWHKADAVWQDVQLLLLRTAAYTIGEHRQLPERNIVWRLEVASWDVARCLNLLYTVERDWPARKIRP